MPGVFIVLNHFMAGVASVTQFMVSVVLQRDGPGVSHKCRCWEFKSSSCRLHLWLYMGGNLRMVVGGIPQGNDQFTSIIMLSGKWAVPGGKPLTIAIMNLDIKSCSQNCILIGHSISQNVTFVADT